MIITKKKLLTISLDYCKHGLLISKYIKVLILFVKPAHMVTLYNKY